MSIIYLLLILTGAQAIRLIEEDDSWLDHDDPPHSYATNMWWRLANYTVKSSNMKGNCYVCTLLPHSSHSTRLEVKVRIPRRMCIVCNYSASRSTKMALSNTMF